MPSRSSQHKFFSRHRFSAAFKPFYANKKIAALTILAFATVGVTATFITNAAQIANEETVILSTGQEVKLGQHINVLKAALDDKLFKLNNNQYIYRQKANDPVEVVVDLDGSQNVVVIHLTNKPNNVVAATNSRVGMNLWVAKYFLRNTSPLPTTVASLRSNGLVVNQTRSSQYLTSDLCTKNSYQASLVSLVLKGHESKYIRDLGGRDCIDRKK